MPAARVLIVDDHRMFAEMLVDVLRRHDDMTVTGIAANGDDAIEAMRADPADVVVLDYRLPGDDGVSVARRLRDLFPEVGLLMLSGFDDDAVLRSALLAGCTGFVTKDRALAELVDAVRAVRAGRGAVDPAATARLAGPSDGSRHSTSLTQREREVLVLLADGLSTREISERLYISLNTARNHVQRLIAKLGAHSRLEAVAVARRNGLLDASSAHEPGIR
jgi:DNA-binding NarL/FixJ family response regulator